MLPEGWNSVTPRIVANGVEPLVAFIRNVFGATGDYRTDRPVVLRIGDSQIMISETGVRDAMPAFLYVYVEDADATYEAAVRAGGRTIEEPVDTPYGDRRCMIEDAWGNVWQIARYRGGTRSE